MDNKSEKIEVEIDAEVEESVILSDRSKNLAKSKRIKDKLYELYKDVEKGFLDQLQRAYDTQDYWDMYNCTLGKNQFYSGNAKICLPLVHNAINARKTRFSNQIFPVSGRHVECISTDGTYPYATMTLMEYYIRKAKLRALFSGILINGDVEGQINISPYWLKKERHIVRRVKKPAEIEPGLEFEDEEVEDIEEETLITSHPAIDVLSDADVLILPLTASGPEEAIDLGGSVTILRRWSKAQVKKMIKEGHIDQKEGDAVIMEMQKDHQIYNPDKSIQIAQAAGVKGGVRGKFALIYETWSNVKTEEGHRLCRTFFGGPNKILSCVRNPYWCDKVPLISVPLERLQGFAKGISKLNAVCDLHYWANDSVNQAADSASFGMLPIVMTDPEKNPRIGSMILNLAAIWQTNPADTKFAEFPQLWKHGFEVIAALKQEIFQTLSVNPSQITQGSKKKQSQAEVANEQQVDILTTADVVTILEHEVLTPLLDWFIELDHQFRDETIRVRSFGELGMKEELEDIEPLQLGTRYEFRWLGVEAARNAQQIQQGIAMVNVIKGIPPQMYKGYELDLAPLISQMVLSTFGPRIAPQIFKDKKTEMSVDPAKEDMLLVEGHKVPVHPMDNHQEHIISHIESAKLHGDPHGSFKVHILDHQIAMMEAMQAQQAQGPKGLPGAPGGAGPGVAGAPRPGAQPGVPRGGQQPPGMIKQDQLQDPRAMPRRMG